MNLALKQIGLTDEQDNAVIILLTAWGIFDRKTSDYGEISKATGQITQSSMNKFKKDLIQEQANSAEAVYCQPYSDEALTCVREVIRLMPPKVNKCIVARYRWRDDKKSPAEKIKAVKMPSRTYYDRIRQGHEIVYRRMDWRLI